MLKQTKQLKTQPKRYDVHRSLANTSYQPNAQPRRDKSSDAKQEGKHPKRRFSFKKTLLVVFILILTPLLIIGAWDARNSSSASKKLFGTGNVAGAFLPTSLESTSENRVNILLVGYSADDPGHAGALLTDSIMVLSLDKEDKTGYMLSVPRDLFVNIPGYGSAKINEAFQAGERQGFSEADYPVGGIGLLQKVVSDNFKIPLHYHVIINYGAVRDIVNALDGVEVNIKSPDPRGLYDPNFKPEEGGPLTLANGLQKIDGQTALRLTRARGSTYGSYGFPQSDLNRIQNQQQVFSAIKNELDWKLLLDPRLNQQFFDAMANNIKTNLKLSEVLPLFRLMRSVPQPSLQPINLSDVDGANLLTSYQAPGGQSALIPAEGRKDFSAIQAAIERLSQ